MPPVLRRTFRQSFSQGISGARTYIKRKSEQLGAQIQNWKGNFRHIHVEYERLRQIIQRIENFQRRMNIAITALLIACFVLLTLIMLSSGGPYKTADHQEWSEEIKSPYGHYQVALPSAGSNPQRTEDQKSNILEARPYRKTEISTKRENLINSPAKKEEIKELSISEQIRKFFEDAKQQVRMSRQLQRLQLEQKNQKNFHQMALQKYAIYQKHINHIEQEIMANNSVMIHRVREYGQKYKGEMQYGPERLRLFAFLNTKQTSPYLFESYWELFKLSVFPFFVDQHGWSYLEDMLQDKGQWKSIGYYLTLGSFSPSLFDYRNSDFNLFVPSIIRFVFPPTVPQGTQFSIYGIRMRYDLYLKKQTYVFRDCLGKFRMTEYQQERQNNQNIHIDFYCESIKCNQAFSLVQIISSRRIQINSIKIDSIFAYHWNEERKQFGQLA